MWLSKALAGHGSPEGAFRNRRGSPEGLRYVHFATRFRRVRLALWSVVLVAQAFRPALPASAQTAPSPVIRVTFKEAIDRAVDKNPSVAAAASGILRSEGLIRQARAGTQFQLTGNVTTTTLNRGVEFQGSTVTPQNQVTASLTADMPIL